MVHGVNIIIVNRVKCLLLVINVVKVFEFVQVRIFHVHMSKPYGLFA